MRKRKWTEEQLREAVISSLSYRQVLKKLHLKEAGGNYSQIKKYIREYTINIEHFRGKLWSQGLCGINRPKIPLDKILIKGSLYQSFKLKKRLFKEGFKIPMCEECGWASVSEDGRVPLELDHINGDKIDNRLSNLRILCPNCHSLKLTHRGRNQRIFNKPFARVEK